MKKKKVTESASGKWGLKYVCSVLCVTSDRKIFLDFIIKKETETLFFKIKLMHLIFYSK